MWFENYLQIENSIVAKNTGIGIDKLSPLTECKIRNCTITQNDGCGLSIAEFNTSIDNSIVWGNGDGNLPFYGTADAKYSDVENGITGVGNIYADPCFVDAGSGDYRLRTEGWRFDAASGEWTWDDETSRCVDAGNPGTLMGDEPVYVSADPYGRIGKNARIDMGAYGGTIEGSMPYVPDALESDLTNDGIVNGVDYAVMAGCDESMILNMPGDLNRDSAVDWEDLAMICERWMAKRGQEIDYLFFSNEY
jgi:hypothetical protein